MYNKGDVQVTRSGLIYLPHSCDEWEIGNEKNARQLIEDLEEMIKSLTS